VGWTKEYTWPRSIKIKAFSQKSPESTDSPLSGNKFQQKKYKPLSVDSGDF
jgi:hypothetical protein